MTVIGRFFINGPGGVGIVCAICGTTMLNVDDALYHPIHAACPNTIKYFERPTVRLGEIPPSSPIADPAAIDPGASYDAVKGENAGKTCNTPHWFIWLCGVVCGSLITVSASKWWDFLK